MIRSKGGLKILSLCALALGLVALYTGASQAEEGANWMVEGKNLTTLSPEVVLAQVVNKDMTMIFTTKGGTKTEILCTSAQFIGAKLEPEGKVTPGNTTKFSGCITKLNGTVSKSCEPVGGSFVSNPLKGLLVLHEGQGVIRFEPAEGTAFVTIALGEACAIGESCTVTGVSTVRESNNEFGVEKVEHIVEQGPLSNLQAGGVPAVIEGKAALALAGAHAGQKWSGLPG